MAITSIRGKQIVDGSVQRADLDTTTVGQAVTAKLIQGTNITLSSTGADAGTGDVTVSVATSTAGFISKSAAYTLTSTDNGKYVICTGGSWTLTLPTAALGLIYQVRNDMGITGTTGTITIATAAGTIDGLASVPLLPQQECKIFTDGTNWRTAGKQRTVVLGTLDITSSTASGSVLLPVGYRYFELLFDGVQPVTSGDSLSGQFSVNGGSTWATTNYYYAILYNSSSTASACIVGENVAGIPIVPNSSASNVGQSKLTIYPGSATLFPSAIADAFSRPVGGPNSKWNAGAYLNTAGLINAFKFSMSSGNILNCFLTVKGVV